MSDNLKKHLANNCVNDSPEATIVDEHPTIPY